MDFVLLFCTLTLALIGCATIYSTGQQAGGGFLFYWRRQLLWLGVGLVIHSTLCIVNLEQLGRWSWLPYLGGLGLLVLVLLFGRTVNQSRSWLPVGPLSMQPSEFAKPTTLLFFAWVAARTRLRFVRLPHLVPLAGVVVPPLVLVGLQPDWGTALVFALMVLPVLFVAGLRWRWIALAAALALLVTPLAYRYALRPHQQERIRTFLDPTRDVSDAGWNAHQSLLAVGSGGVAGKGFMRGTQHILGFLPRAVAPTDFVFSVVAEENGFIGSAVVLAALLVAILRCLRIAAIAGNAFGAYVAVGTAGLLLVHAFINIGMNVQAAPIIGIPLPLISYGGSFTVAVLACLGLVQAVYVQRPEP